jgi:large subunit ribosomal protein L30
MNMKVTLVRSIIGKLGTQKRVVKALGFSKRGQSIVLQDSPVIRGMINKIKHLVTIEKMDGDRP